MRRPLVGTAVSATLILAACSSGGGGETTPSPTSTESPEAAAAVDVTATEYSFAVPGEVAGGVVQMRFTNTGGYPHEFAFARIEEGKTEADVKAVIESGEEPPEWAEDVAGVPALSPGQSVAITRTLEPGSYVFLCFFPDSEGTPHAALGMYELFTIAGASGAALPEPDATITATDDGLELPDLSSGEQTVEFENGGTKPHELALVAFEPGQGVKDVDHWIGSGYQGEPPMTFLGGMQTIPAGESVFLTIDLESGVEYTALDFTTNRGRRSRSPNGPIAHDLQPGQHRPGGDRVFEWRPTDRCRFPASRRVVAITTPAHRNPESRDGHSDSGSALTS